jgi:hypothetical protein
MYYVEEKYISREGKLKIKKARKSEANTRVMFPTAVDAFF